MTEELKRVLSEIQSSLCPLTFSMRKYIDNGLEVNIDDIDTLGQSFISLANRFRNQLKELKHTVLSLTLMEAGVSIRGRVRRMRRRGVSADDIVFFEEVYSLVKLIEDSIASGEYYEELLKIYRGKLNEDLHTHT
ncbi:MAG: hypothetical protein QXS51_03520 [Thermoproteota archaeon]|nr:hypothetical protein [Candidatus Brockarchaeota archaeon]